MFSDLKTRVLSTNQESMSELQGTGSETHRRTVFRKAVEDGGPTATFRSVSTGHCIARGWADGGVHLLSLQTESEKASPPHGPTFCFTVVKQAGVKTK